MSNMRATCVFAVLVLSGLSLVPSASAQNDPPADVVVRPRQTPDGPDTLAFPVGVPKLMDDSALETTGSLTAVFEFRDTKGLSEKALVNQDKSLIAVTNDPATKTTYTHLFIRHPNGDLTAVNSFNRRVAKLLTGRWATAAESKVMAVSISGRVMQLKVVNYTKGNEFEELTVKVSVGQDGTLTLVR